jgi:hypothetical protein
MNNTRALALLLAAALPTIAVAAPPEAVTVMIDCQRPQLPSQQAIARLTGVDNFGQAYAVRARLMVDSQRACQNNVGAVQLTLSAPRAARTLAKR